MTAVSSWKTTVDNGYWIWTFQGRILKRVNLNAFNQLLWRPRPPTLLTAEQIKEIKKNLKKYSAQFESKDRMRLTRASKVCKLLKYLIAKLCLYVCIYIIILITILYYRNLLRNAVQQ